MKLSILAVSNEYQDNTNIQDCISQMETFSGKAAGVCYMKDDYFGTYVSDPKKAEKRFDRVISTGHHSISDHSFISVLFEDMPKMTAMILNSLGFYNTSEKSGRYTVMHGAEKNVELYNKWYNIFYKKIYEYDTNIDTQKDGTHDDTLRKKLALENARYMLSVFDCGTTMVYTTSLRMWSYIVSMCDNYLDNSGTDTLFNSELIRCIRDLRNKIVECGCYSKKIVDNKHRTFNFLCKQIGYNVYEANERYDDAYLIKYKASFACLAQLQRHRTLDYFMDFDGSNTKFYVPKLLERTDTSLVKEWLDDLHQIKDTFPNATLVDVIETGLITNFMLKCDERLCGRTQLETFENVSNNLYKFARSWDKSPFTITQLDRHIRDGKIIMKCGNIRCKEPCYWGPIKSQSKLI